MAYGIPVRVTDRAEVVVYQERIRDAPILRYSADLPHGVQTFMGPAPNESWEILCFQVEAQHDANVGLREYYQYVQDRKGDSMRFEMFKGVAATIYKYLGFPGNVGPSATVGPGDFAPLVNGTEMTLTGPCYIGGIDHPCRIGVLRSGFNGVGDICTLHVLVRERVRL